MIEYYKTVDEKVSRRLKKNYKGTLRGILADFKQMYDVDPDGSLYKVLVAQKNPDLDFAGVKWAYCFGGKPVKVDWGEVANYLIFDKSNIKEKHL